jgi:hypothetical protein
MTSHGIDLARDDALHQNVSAAHTVAFLSISPYSRVVDDRVPAIAFTYIVPAYRPAARAPSAIPTREAVTPTRTSSRVLPRRSPHRRWAARHVDTVALTWS